MKINIEQLAKVINNESDSIKTFKYDTISKIIDIFLDFFNENIYDEEGHPIEFTIDDAPISVKIAYNTLLFYEII